MQDFKQNWTQQYSIIFQQTGKINFTVDYLQKTLTLTGCRSAVNKVNLEVFRTRDGFPNRASIYLKQVV